MILWKFKKLINIIELLEINKKNAQMIMEHY